MSNEAEARYKIDKLLEKSGLRFIEDENGPKNVFVESRFIFSQKHIF